jgi:hypothetical protein
MNVPSKLAEIESSLEGFQVPVFKRLLPIAIFLVFFFVMARLEFSTPNLPDNDGFYHIKMAWLMRTQSLKPDFPWLPLTILNEKEFYDHHFLFHVALIPFTFGDLLLGAKWAAVFFASLAFLAIWYLFKRQRVPLHWLWAIALLGLSDPFLYRMSVTRAQSLSLGMLAVGMFLLLEGKYKYLAALSFIYVWMYDAFPLMLALGVLHFIAVALIERRFEFRPLLYIAGGILAGILINPYFPNNIIFSVRHMLPKLTDATSTNVGNEWYPYDTGQILNNSFPSLVVFAGGVFALGLSGRKMDVRTAFGLLTALLFGLMFFQARRFVEYFPPFALIFAAFAFAPLLDRGPVSVLPGDVSPRRFLANLQPYLPVILLGFATAAGMYITLPAASNEIIDSKPNNLYQGASEWLIQNTPEGSRVFHTDWDDFPRLFFYDTHNTYIVGLDPTYMQIYNSELYDTWVSLTRGDMKPISYVVATTFQARYIQTDLYHGDFLDNAAHDPGLVEVYRDDQSVIFEVVSP